MNNKLTYELLNYNFYNLRERAFICMARIQYHLNLLQGYLDNGVDVSTINKEYNKLDELFSNFEKQYKEFKELKL